MIDLVLHRYGSVDCLNSFDIRTIIQLIKYANEQELDEWIHAQWCSMLPLMSMQMLEYKSFAEYKDSVTGRNIDTRSTSEILDDVEKIRKKFEVNNGS